MILRPMSDPDEWQAGLARPHHWQPGYSAMETAHAWQQATGAPPEIAALLPPDAELVQAIPEYPVSLPGGGRPSFTDVFALFSEPGGLHVAMIEGKRDESFGPTLSDRLAEASPGVLARRDFLLSTLGLETEEVPGTIRYQLLHRTVSALLTARRFHARRASVIVQSFSAQARWFEDFAAFGALLGAEVAPNRLVPTRIDAPVPLHLGWATAPLRTDHLPRIDHAKV